MNVLTPYSLEGMLSAAVEDVVPPYQGRHFCLNPIGGSCFAWDPSLGLATSSENGQDGKA